MNSQKLSSSLEDYLEVIFNLLAESEVARSKDIADALAVAKPSVTGALKVLSERGLINYKPYGYVTLTEAGKQKAANIAKKHDVIKSFLVDVLGVDDDSAQTAACKLEHSLGPNIISRLTNFIEFSTNDDKSGINIAEKFQNDYRSKYGK